MRPGEWVDKLLASVDEYMRLETTDGVKREGRISGFTYKKFELDGDEVLWPIELEVNGDPTDRIPLARIGKINIG
jgi:hypothetical protein